MPDTFISSIYEDHNLFCIKYSYRFGIVAPWCYVGRKGASILGQALLPYHPEQKTPPCIWMSIDDEDPIVLRGVIHRRNVTSNKVPSTCQNYQYIKIYNKNIDRYNVN